MIAVGAGGFLLGRQVKSPSDAAAEVAAPPPSRLAVPVERRVLSSTIITRGDVRYGDPKPVVLAPSTLKAGQGNLVTQPATKGQAITSGSRILELAGRPVIALIGATPAYRDMRPGDVGDDVRQLEEGLRSLSFNPGAVDGAFDAATERAVSSLYGKLGYEPFGPTESQRTQLQQLRESASRATDSVRSAQRAYDTALAPAKSRRLQADEQLRAAQDKSGTAGQDATTATARAEGLVATRAAALDQAKATVDQSAAALRRAERERDDPAAVADANRAVDDASAALADAEAGIAQAQRGVPEAQRAIDDARANVIDAQKSVDTAREAERKGTAFTCPTPTPCEVPDNSAQKEATRNAESRLRQAQGSVDTALSALTTRQDAIPQAQRARDRAARAVTRAEEGVTKAINAAPDRDQTVVDTRARLAQSEAALAQAQRDLEDAVSALGSTARQGTNGVVAADAAVGIAKAGLGELVSPTELRTLRSSLDSAIVSQRRADADLAELNAKVGIAVPANEVIFLPDLPRRVDDVKVGRGEPANGAVITVTNARLAVDASVDAVDATRLRAGNVGEIEAEDLSLTLAARITKIANRPGTDGAEADKVHVELTIDASTSEAGVTASTVDAATLNGVTVKVTLPIQSTGQAVLAVPVAAVSIAGDGSSRIEIEDAPQRPTRFVTVVPGLAAEGYVEITPVAGARLREGDLAVVGSAGAQDLTVTSDTTTAERPSADTTSVDASANSSSAPSSAPIDG